MSKGGLSMTVWRIEKHPILTIPETRPVPFYWNGEKLLAREGEVISAALFANGIRLFGRHAKDQSPQGIFCANGQCAQCAVIANGVPVKGCMTEIKRNMIVQSSEGLAELPQAVSEFEFSKIPEIKTDVLIIGGGPAGLSAAIQLGKSGIDTIVVDDKSRIGGKLVLQTHKFFGSIEDCYAGTRGTEIARILEDEIGRHASVKIWLNSTALYVFGDKKVGIVTRTGGYSIVEPEIILNAAGAREKSLVFPGNTLPGVYGAGAFQTLVNRDLVKPAQNLFIIGGGNVGLIAAYHALQADINVVGVVEALPECSGYQVHADKIRRLGVPIYTRHTILSANGTDQVESVTVSRIDDHFKPMKDTARAYACDAVLIGVGLNPINEFIGQAKQAGVKIFAAGDANEIAEVSYAMIGGKIAGLEIARELGLESQPIPPAWHQKAGILKRKPGPILKPDYDRIPEEHIVPVFHCAQEIPCNPCVSVCPKDVIVIPGDSLLGIPQMAQNECSGCNQCLFVCPGLAISLVDYREDVENPTVSLAYEVYNHEHKKGDIVRLADHAGNLLQAATILETVMKKGAKKTQIVKVQVPRKIAKTIAGFRIQSDDLTRPNAEIPPAAIPDVGIVCRCERVGAAEIRALIHRGIRDLNQIKAITRAGMGACGAKTCENLILQLFQEEGVSRDEVTLNTRRPVYVEIPLGLVSNITYGEERNA